MNILNCVRKHDICVELKIDQLIKNFKFFQKIFIKIYIVLTIIKLNLY